MKQKKCTAGEKHKWNFIKNIVLKRQTYSGCVELKMVGKYKCNCGEFKYGEYRPGD